MSDRATGDLEHALRDLGERLDHPAAPGLAADVVARLTAEALARRPSPWARPGPRRGAVAMLVAAALAATLVLWTPARQAVAQLFGLNGVRFTEEPPPPVPLGGLRLGERVDLGEARRRADFPLRTPRGPGAPDVYLDTVGPGPTVSLVYPPREGVPAIGSSGIGVVLSQFRGRLEQPRLVKHIGEGTRLRPVDVGGSPGWWVDGLPHVVVYQDEAGRMQEDGARLAGNVLLWEVEGTILRLESGLSLDHALALAATLR